MSIYTIIILKASYKTQEEITAINEMLFEDYGTTNNKVFVTPEFLQQRTDYYNNHPKGLLAFSHLQRPITAKRLSKEFIWYRPGELYYDITNLSIQQAINLSALLEWMYLDGESYVDFKKSKNVDECTIYQYLHDYVQSIDIERIEYPDWTRRKYLNKEDKKQLQYIYRLYVQLRFSEAIEYASYSVDTAIRDEIPEDIWAAMGGQVLGREIMRRYTLKRKPRKR